MKTLYYLILFCLSTVVTVQAQNDDWKFIEMLNQYRIDNELSVLQESQELTNLAKKHSDFLVKYNNDITNGIVVFHSSHGKFENLNIKLTTENNFQIYRNDFNSWVNSIKHNENLLNKNVKYLGYANQVTNITVNNVRIALIFSVLILE